MMRTTWMVTITDMAVRVLDRVAEEGRWSAPCGINGFGVLMVDVRWFCMALFFRFWFLN